MMRIIWPLFGVLVLTLIVFFLMTLKEIPILMQSATIVTGLVLIVERALSAYKIFQEIQSQTPILEIIRFDIINNKDDIDVFRKDVLGQIDDDIQDNNPSDGSLKKIYGTNPIVDLIIKNSSSSNITIKGIDVHATRQNDFYNVPAVKNPENKISLFYLGVRHIYDVALDPSLGFQSPPVRNVSQDLPPKSSDRICVTIGHHTDEESPLYPPHYYDVIYEINLTIFFNKDKSQNTSKKILTLRSLSEKTWKNSKLNKPSKIYSDNIGWEKRRKESLSDDISVIYEKIKSIKQIVKCLLEEGATEEKLEFPVEFIAFIESQIRKFDYLEKKLVEKDLKSIKAQINLIKEKLNKS